MRPTTDELRAHLFEIAPDLEGQAIGDDADLINELDIDSMDFLDFIIKLSKNYGVEIPEADYPKLGTLSGCATYLASRVEG